MSSEYSSPVWIPEATSLGFMAVIWIGFLQNFLAIVFARWSFTFARGLLVVKDLLLYLVMLAVCMVCLVRLRLPSKGGRLCLLAIVVLLSFGLISRSFNVLSMRQLLIIPLYFLYGTWFCRKASLSSIRRLLLISFGVIVATGFIERFVLFDARETFWRAIGIKEYLDMKGFSQWAFGTGGLPGNFYTYDLLGWGRDGLRRMVSLLAEPTLLGQLLVFPLLYSLMAKKPISSIMYSTAMLLTMSKGGIIGLIAGYAWFYCSEKKNIVIKFLLISSVLAVLAGFAYLVMMGSAASVLIHFGGLVNNLAQLKVHPLGGGIGSAGNFAVLNDGTGDVGAGESYLGALVGQLGVVGLLAYGWLTLAIHRIKPPKDAFLMAVKYSCLATLLTGIASESAISYVGTGFIFALLPFLLSRSTNPQLERLNCAVVAV